MVNYAVPKLDTIGSTGRYEVEEIDEFIAEFDRYRFVKRDAGFFSQDEIKESNLTEPDDKICCRFKIFEV